MGAWIDFVSYIAKNYYKVKCFAKTISNAENCSYDFLGLFTEVLLLKEKTCKF
jgi:hypothetical protein